MTAERAWVEEGVCISWWSHQEAEVKVLPWQFNARMVNAISKREIYFHVESQPLSEPVMPY
jgi:hypothetical protein